MQEKAQEVATVTAQAETQLQTTVTQVQQEIFSTSCTSSSIEQSLPTTVQQQVEAIKQEVPAEQIPQVSVEAQAAQSTSVTVTTESVNTSPAPTSAPVQPAAAPQAPAPEVKPPEQSQPAPPSTTVPGL